MSFRYRKGRSSFSVSKRGVRAGYRLGCLLPLALVLASAIAACSDDSELQPLPLAADPTARPTGTVIGPTPAPVATPGPVATPAAVEVYFANCADARAAGAAPLREGQPGYRAGLDRDNDGVACE